MFCCRWDKGSYHPEIPPSDIFLPNSTPYSSPSEVSLMLFTKLLSFPCAWFLCLHLCAIWDRTGTSSSPLFFFFFGGDFFGADRLERLHRWGGRISSEWRRDNDLARPRMGKITIYHVQSRSEFSESSSEQNCAMWLDLALAPPLPVRGACKSQIQYIIKLTH